MVPQPPSALEPRIYCSIVAGDTPAIKDTELQDVDSALGGIVSELVQTHEFAGKAVRTPLSASREPADLWVW